MGPLTFVAGAAYYEDDVDFRRFCQPWECMSSSVLAISLTPRWTCRYTQQERESTWRFTSTAPSILSDKTSRYRLDLRNYRRSENTFIAGASMVLLLIRWRRHYLAAQSNLPWPVWKPGPARERLWHSYCRWLRSMILKLPASPSTQPRPGRRTPGASSSSTTLVTTSWSTAVSLRALSLGVFPRPAGRSYHVDALCS